MKKLLGLIALFALVASCEKKVDLKNNVDSPNTTESTSENNIVNPNIDVYVAGEYMSNIAYQATYWKNGKMYSVESGNQQSFAKGIAVDSNNVYLVGKCSDRAAYWKNGNRSYLRVSLDQGVANAICIRNNKAFIAGIAKSEQNGDWIAILWIVDTITNSTEEYPLAPAWSRANDLFDDGTNLYIAGMENDKPCYWKWDGANFLRTDVGNNVGVAKTIFKHNNVIYMVGDYAFYGGGTTVSGYWENEKFINASQITSGLPQLEAIGFNSLGEFFASGNKILGAINNGAAVWKSNKTEITLSGAGSGISTGGMAFNGSDYYLCGYELKGNGLGGYTSDAVYWMNGTPISLNTTNSFAMDITLVEK